MSTNGQNPETYVKAYQHVHDIFKAEGATKVQWIWCFNNADVPGEAWNDVAKAYPGDAYVDWVSIDGYNWGTNPSWGSWTSFRDVFKSGYDRALKIAPSKPIIIGEFASSEVGGDKGQWILNMFADLPKLFPQIKAIVWFDIQKEEDWRIDSSQISKERMVLGLRSKDVRGNGAALLKVPSTFTAPPPPTGKTRTIASFETLAEGRLTTAEGGKVFLSGFQEKAENASTFSNQDQGNEPAAVVYPAGNGLTQRAGFDFNIKAPNAYAGVLMSLEVKPRNAEGQPVSVDYSAYKSLRLTVKATGTSRLRLEFIGAKSLGIPDGGYPQVYVDVGPEVKTINVPVSSFAQPDWASPKKPTTEVLQNLVTINVVADTVPSTGNVQVDDVMLVE